MLFANTQLIRRIEAAEVSTLRAIVGASDSGWTVLCADGAALFRTAGSPFTKLVGFGFAPLSAAELEGLEARYAQEGAPVQVELATAADPALTNLLARRGYVFTGYEQVLGRTLDALLSTDTAHGIRVRPALDGERESWVNVLSAGALVPASGEEHAEHDTFAVAEIRRALQDMANAPGVMRWLAVLDGELAGGASMFLRDGIAQLSGAATVPSARRRGVQGALLAARLTAAHSAGCDLAVLTTQPGTQSQHNAERAGFKPLYARAIWRREFC